MSAGETGPGPLLGRAAFERLADAGLEAGGDGGVEVVVTREGTGVTRFANSQIHQNVWRETVTAAVRVATGDGRVGVVSVTTDDPADVATAARDAAAAAAVSPPDSDFPGLAPAADVGSVHVDEATLAAGPFERAAAVRAILAESPDPLEAAGAYTTSATEVGVFTSEGQRAYAPMSSVAVTLVLTGPSSSGYADGGGRAMADVDPAALGRRAAEKVRAGENAVHVDAGDWTVVLEPPAVADVINFLTYTGFGGRALLEGRSFLAERLGTRIVDPAITLVDDARSPATTGLPLDAEGTPKQAVTLVAEGVATAVVHDRATAHQAGVVSTGHALPAPNTIGPYAANPILRPGPDGSIDDLVAGCERGLLVTRFHYTNVVHPKRTVITGMTRDGTFLVEDGRVTSAVHNLRFTQSILAALERVGAISTETRFTELFDGGAHLPALRLPSFSFTGTTSFG